MRDELLRSQWETALGNTDLAPVWDWHVIAVHVRQESTAYTVELAMKAKATGKTEPFSVHVATPELSDPAKAAQAFARALLGGHIEGSALTIDMRSQSGLHPVYHSKGTAACKQIAFFTSDRWNTGDRMEAHDVELLNGTTPGRGTPIICGACGKRLASADMSFNADGTN